MTLCRFVLTCAMLLPVFQTSYAQHFFLDVDAELTATRVNPNTDPERTINTNFRDDDPFNPVRAKIFPTVEFTKTLAIEGDFLFDNKAKRFDRSKGNQPFRMDGLFLAVKGLWEDRLNFWFGRIPTPVGNFSPRSYSHTNPLIGWPLAYHYKVPYNVFTASSEAANLTLRDLGLGAGTSIYEACWITGISAFGQVGVLEYMVDLGRGTLTNPEAGANKGFQLAGRMGINFSSEFKSGISAGIAPYLEHGTGLPVGTSIRDPKHVIMGIDATYKNQRFFFTAEVFLNSWDTPQYQNDKAIRATTWYLEGQYFILPGLYSALRYDQMTFHDITEPVTGKLTPWAYDISRIEAGIGFRPLSVVNLKTVVQHNVTSHPTSGNITFFALQSAFRFEDVQTLFGLDSRKRPAYE